MVSISPSENVHAILVSLCGRTERTTDWMKLHIANVTHWTPYMSKWLTVCVPKCHMVFSQACVATLMSSNFNRSLAALSVRFFLPLHVCVTEKERKRKMEAAVAPLPSSLSRLNWGQMLWDAKEPTCLLSECLTYTKLGHSFTYSLPLSPLLPFPTPPDSLYLMQKCGPQLPLPPNRGRS